jgi:endogenous inhibitor of DNA gyrase (YacG/DUF329 family)
MTTWDDDYLVAPLDFGVPDTTVTKLEGLTPCAVCGRPTAWWDLSFEVPACSRQCDDLLWERFRAEQERAALTAEWRDLP